MKLIKLLKPVNKKEIMSLGIEPLLEHRFPNIPLYATVDGWLGKVYLDYFWKDKIKYLKIGFTQFKETVDRKIKAHECFVNGTDKWVETSMYEYFDKYKPAKSIQNRKEIAIKCEKKIKDIFNEISKPADLPKMNGMSEIFVWTKQLDTIARKLMDKNQYKG
jgi:hypothetical protein|tara:strand:+ start:171 stop:656 length:486 start_codon:yes stop_codon:yes gene_type:complete